MTAGVPSTRRRPPQFAALRGTVACLLLVAGPAAAFNISGTVFEDANYGGGAGRSQAASGGSARTGARVELYDNAGNFVSTTNTNGAGNYNFNGLANGTYTVRVVSSTVTSSRAGYVAGLLPVQTYRTTATTGAAAPVTDRVGGEVPSKADAGNGATTLAALATATTAPQSITTVTASSNVTGVDFGFNFDTVVNVNDAGHGSLRQVLTNANTLGNVGLSIQGQTAGRDVSIFMVSDGAPHAGLRAGLPNLLNGSGVAVITVASALPSISTGGTTLDGSTQTTNVGNTNGAMLGTGGTVGVDAVALNPVAGPEVEIRTTGTIAAGVSIQADNTTVRGVAIYGFGAATGEGSVVIAAFTGALVENCVLGAGAASFADPGAALRSEAGVYLGGSTSATVRYNVIGFTRVTGVYAANPTAGCTVLGNEIRDAGMDTADGDGITFNASSTCSITGNLVTGSSSQAVVITTAPSTGNTFTNNTMSGNGVGLASSVVQSPAVCLRSGPTGCTFDRNVINANYGAGIQVNSGVSGAVLTRNSIYDNGTITARNGAGPTGQVGIDLNAPTDDNDMGTAPFYSLNDNGDGDTGGNSRLNYPVLTTAVLSGANLTVQGYARPGSVIELFLAAADPSGFGEGQTYVMTLTEGGTGAGGNDPYADTDATSGSYGPGAINGIAQGTDNTNKFAFTMPAPGGVAAGGKLTATARLGGQTSEFSGTVTVTALDADLALTLTDAPDPAPAGGEFLYTILVTNNGPGSTTSVTVLDTLPAGVTLVSATASQGSVSGTSIIIANLGSILNGGTATVEVLVTTAGPGTLVDRAYVSAAETDLVAGNNMASATTTVVNATTSDIPLTPYKRIHGFIDAVVTGGSLRTASNNVNPCAVGASSTALLSGIPVTATIHNAYLYWAGSGQTVDNNITLDGAPLTADRTFSVTFDLGGTTYYDFGGFKDVTAQVAAKRNGNYTFGGLTVATGNPYCSAQAVLAGWSLIVIYDDNAASGKTLVLYDGFDITRNGTANYLLSGIYASAPTEAKATFLVWEGDETLNGAGESLLFDGATLSDGLNPANNVYNSTVNTLPSSTTYGLDLDTFDVSAQVQNHDVLANAVVSTAADLVITNAVLLEVKSNVISGHVFEDVDYGGGAGRNLATATAAAPSFNVGRAGAVVELYDTAGTLLRTTVTGVGGEYGFAGLVDGDYDVRVVNSSVTSSRPGATGNERSVQTYRADATTGTAVAVTDQVGGSTPGGQDAPQNPGGANLTSFTAQSVSRAKVVTGISVTDVDFGYSFDVVCNKNNTGQGSLRQWMLNANALANTNLAQAGRATGTEHAVWMLADGTARPGLSAAYPTQFLGGVASIVLASALPTLSTPAVFDAQTQPGWSSAPLVELNGASAGAVVSGLTLTGGATTVRGLIVNRFTSNGIAITTAGGDTVAGCWIGTNASGTAAAANGNHGLQINGVGANVVGGTALTDRNVLSGNAAYGIDVVGAGATNNVVIGNFIGLNAGGVAAVANQYGVIVEGAATGTVIGGTTAAARNVVSGNTRSGILVQAAGTDNNVIQGNHVGTDSSGTAMVANGDHGVVIKLGARNNSVGGLAAGAGNAIVGNGLVGVVIGDNGTRFNPVLGNSIHGNGGLGIDLDADGVTANNGTKNASLPDDNMDSPVFTSAVLAAGSLTVAGYVGSAAGQATFANARVEVFLSDNDPSGHGEGRAYVGALTADASGNFSGTLAAPGLSVGDHVTATATDGSNNTSEFGLNQLVVPLTIVKRAFDQTGAPIATGAVIPKGAVVKWLIYVSNPGPAVPDLSLKDVLDPAFAYLTGTIRSDNSLAACANGGCSGAQEAAIFSAASTGTAGSDGLDGDPVSRSGSTVYVGDHDVANAPLTVSAGKVYAVVFTVRVQ